MLYNPFSNSLDTIESEDLEILEEVSESWFIEYKKEPVGLKKIAKEICAFANQFGGWIFIGIEENSQKQTAGVFSGIKTNDVSNVLVQIRNAVSAHIQPTPDYKAKVINGPCEKIGLEENKSIVIISVPQGIYPPYVHSYGKIYRRIGDESSPETDRYELDKLWERGEKLEKRFRNFLEKEPYYDNNEIPRVTIYFLTDPKKENDWAPLSFQDFQSVMGNSQSSEEQTMSIPFDTIYSSSNGFVARQHESNDPNQDVATFRWNHTGNAILEIPLNSYSQGDFKEYLNYKDEGEKFLTLLFQQRFRRCSIIDFSYCIQALAAAASQYLELINLLEVDQKLYVKAKVSNIGGKTPFLNSEEYFNEINEWGLPIIKENKIWCPKGLGLDDLTEIEIDENQDIIFSTAGITGNILRSIGILRNIDDFESMKDILTSSLQLKPPD